MHHSLKAILAISMFTFFTLPAFAMESPRFQIQNESVEVETVKDAQQDSLIQFQLNKDEMEHFQKDGFIITVDDSSLNYAVSNTLVSFGSQKEVIVKKGIQLKTTSINTGASIYLLIEKPLQSFTNETIPFISCSKCSPYKAIEWTHSMYGLGYSLIGSNTPIDFRNNDYVRSFSNKTGFIPLNISGLPSTTDSTLFFEIKVNQKTAESSFSTEGTLLFTPTY